MISMMKRTIFTLLAGLLGLALQAQWYNPEKVNKKAQMAYRAAIDNLRSGQWVVGKSLLQVALKQEPRYVEAWLSLMSAYGEKKMYDSAIIAFETAWQLDSLYSEDMQLPFAINLAGAGRFEDAMQSAQNYAATVSPDTRAGRAAAYRIRTYVFALDFKKNNPTSFIFDPRNLGDSINSTRSEYYPSFTIDDSLLVFTRLMQGFREDFYSSRLQADGNYGAASPIDGILNQEPSKGGIQMSPDGDWLFFAGNFPGVGFGDFDLYYCQSTPSGWSEPMNLGTAINTDFWESSPCISPDKKTLFFSSNRPGGFGGKDLYYSERQTNGRWSLAMNMGAGINTAADDLAPFIHADNQTLYFTSGGHPGYGGSDIYLIRRQPDGEWGKPENLGFPINTTDDDGSLIVAANGKTAYFASARTDSRGGLDLYRFELPEYARALKTQWVQGRVYDQTNQKGLPSAITLTSLQDSSWTERVVTDETGRYLITLPVGRSYSLTVSRQGYLYYSDAFNLEGNPTDSNYRKDIPLEPIKLNAAMALKNILFETNSFRLSPTSFVELDKLVALLMENNSLQIEIGGHTDNVGNLADNLKLSTNRAKAVVDYLVSKGIDLNKLSFKGYGSTRPLTENDTEDGRAKNRRTEIKVTGF